MAEKFTMKPIRSIVIFAGCILIVEFDDGMCKSVDVSQLFNHKTLGKTLSRLKGNKRLFDSAKIDAAGIGVSWGDSIGIECNDLYYYGHNLKTNVRTNSKSSALKPKTTTTRQKKTPARV